MRKSKDKLLFNLSTTVTVIFLMHILFWNYFIITIALIFLIMKILNLSKFHYFVCYLIIFSLHIFVTIQLINISQTELQNGDNATVCVERNLETQDYISFEGEYQNKNYSFLSFAPVALKYGDCVTFKNIKIQPFEQTFYNTYSFSYPRYMNSKSIYYQVTSNDIELESSNYNLFDTIKNYREHLRKKNDLKYEKNSKMINSIVLGYDEFSEPFELILETSGLLHVFSISGTHVIILLEILNIICKKFNFSNDNKNYLTFIVTFLLYLIGGMQIPLARAAYTEITFLIFGYKYKKHFLSRTFFIVIFLSNPLILFNPSYQLTFLSTELVYGFKEPKIFFPLYMFLFMLPLTININYGINLAGIVFSLPIEFLICSIMLPLGIIMSIFPKIYFLNFLFYLCNCMVHFLTTISSWFFMITGYFSYPFVILITIFYFSFNKYIRYIFPLLLLVVLPITDSQIGQISFLDVGQGSSTLIEYPDGETVLIDTGDEDAGTELINELRASKIKKIDHLVLTHNHSDHNSNVDLLQENFKIKNIYTSEFDQHSGDYRNETKLKTGDSITIQNQKITILAPYAEDENENNESIAFLLELGGKTFFFGGDSEKIIEEQLIENTPEMNVDFLIVNHHGSATSTSDEFIRTISPTHAIISSGRNNSYNHPAVETIEVLNKYNVTIENTQNIGEINYYFDDKNIWSSNDQIIE